MGTEDKTEVVKGALIEMLVEGEGLADVQVIRVRKGSRGREIVSAVAKMGGYPPDEAVLFVEDGDGPLDLEAVVEEPAARQVHHVHRAQHVDVIIYYQNQQVERRFRPSTRVQRVLDFAVGPDGFKNIDRAIVPELELALHNTKAALPKNAHIGRFIRHPEHRLELDLIRGVIPNGALW